MRRWAAALALLAAPVDAQDDAAVQVAAEAALQAKYAGRYLDAANAWRPLAFDPTGRPVPGDAYDSWIEAETRMTIERPGPPAPLSPLPPADLARLRAAIPRDALAEIVARARRTRVVVLNEDHGQPRGRAFGLAVARALRPLGYRVLALETLEANPDPALAARRLAGLIRDGYPRQVSGYYTADPVFGDFVRQALAMGYRPLACEQIPTERLADPDDQIVARELAQATHLAAALRAEPSAKMFVYVGFGHVAEAPAQPGATPWMAARLKVMTGIDPLTIDQVALAEDPSDKRGDGYAVIADRATGRSVVLFTGAKPLVVGQYAGAVDLQVVHPRVRHIAGRPDWLLGMGRQPTPVPPTLLPHAGTRLVQAFLASEAADAIPIDQVLVTAGRPAPSLMLPPRARVRYATQDEAGAPPLQAAQP
ncbi:hypothetical protein [Sphingomonas bacterium]|uniref:hypothetical protein n=1 Tax=Sphingomonas bacterium TaxID=1895847 RepID=UPI0015759A3D|nr:hypothetical protein [Sphingomonas bacterium]